MSCSDGGARLLSIWGGFLFCHLLHYGCKYNALQDNTQILGCLFLCSDLLFSALHSVVRNKTRIFVANTRFMLSLRLKELCKKRGLTLTELAAKIGVSQPTISGFQTGKVKPSFDSLEKLCAALNVSPGELFEQPPAAVARCPHCGGSLEISLSPSVLSAPPRDEDAGAGE